MKLRHLLAGLAASVALAGCQTPHQNSVALTKEGLAAKTGRVAVVMHTPPTDLYLPGAGCLLCMAAAAVANSSMNTYAKTLKADELLQVKPEIVEMLRAKGVDAAAIGGQLDLDKLPDLKLGVNMATKDFSSVAPGFDHIVVVDVQQLGLLRNYSGYIPSSDARATVDAYAYMVNLKTNAYEWYAHISITRSADGKWDEPPAFPGLTNAYYQAVELAKDRIKAPFAP